MLWPSPSGPLHGVGGLERHVADLVTHLTRRGSAVTLITRPATVNGAADLAARFELDPSRFRVITAPYFTFPGAGRRGTTIRQSFARRNRSSAERAGRHGDASCASSARWISCTRSAPAGSATRRRGQRHEHTRAVRSSTRRGSRSSAAPCPGSPAVLKRIAYTPLQDRRTPVPARTRPTSCSPPIARSSKPVRRAPTTSTDGTHRDDAQRGRSGAASIERGARRSPQPCDEATWRPTGGARRS